jgi:glycolate oxidase iron-sulfur subunit
MHAGDENIARRLGRKNINAFLSQDYLAVIGNAGGCTAMLKVAYPSLLEKNPVDRARAAAFSAKVRDINEFVAEHADVCAANRVEARVAYVESCHLRNVLRSSEPIRELMNSIPGLRLAPLSSEHCCGSAGIYNITQAETADRILDLKLQDIVRCQADVVVVNNTGCHLQMLRGVSKSGLNCRVMHSVELLSAAFSDEKPDANRLSPSAARATPSEDRV